MVANDLALVDLLRKRAREEDREDVLILNLIHAGSVLGLTRDEINDALDSDRMLTIYEP
jgi:hypothetical protein